jgi:hypothetical protein
MMQLSRPHAAGQQLRPAGTCIRPSLRSRTVVRAEGPSGSKPVREFREDTGEVSVPGESKQQPGSSGAPLYADQVAMVSQTELAQAAAEQGLQQEQQ